MNKKLLIFFVLSCVQSALGNSRYVTLTDSNRTETVLKTDVIEIVGIGNSTTAVLFHLPNGESFPIVLFNQNTNFRKHIYTGAVRVELPNSSDVATWPPPEKVVHVE